MDPSEADARYGATAMRALDGALLIAAREPQAALTQARKAVEAVALHLYARELGDPEAAPKRLMLDDLLKALSKQRLIPEGVGMHFGTVQRYGNYGSHPQADDASVGNTVAFNQPCIESLRFIARWYVKDKLRLAEAEVPENVRAFALSSGATQPDPAPHATGPRQVTTSAAPSAADPFGLMGACLDGKYEIEAMVAEGGFGAVYRGRHLTLEKPIALKVLKSPPDATEKARAAFVEGFALEAKTIARLEHPAIVKVLDFGVSQLVAGAPAPWMVLEWLTGETLGHELDRRRGTPGRSPVDCLALLHPVLEAVAYAHAQGIAHRDIKPANIMLPPPSASAQGGPSDSRPRPPTGSFGRRGELGARLLDFGIAKIMRADEGEASGHTHTQSSMVAFSLPYAAPEQVSGTRTGPWTDVHALALVLVEMLVHQKPYIAKDPQELYMAILSPIRPTPARFGLDVGPWEAVLARALAPRPADRYQSAGDLLDALAAEVPSASKPLSGAAPPARTDAWAPPTTGPAAPPETLRGAEVSPPRAEPRRRGLLLAGAALGVAALVGGLLVRNAASAPPAPSARPSPTVAALAVAAPPAPPAPPAPSAPAVAADDAAPVAADAAVAPTEVAEDDDSSSRRGRRRRRSRRHGEGRDAPAAAPQRIHAD